MAETIELEEPQSRVEKLLMVINQNLAGVAGVSAVRFEAVNYLPETGNENSIYLLKMEDDSDSGDESTETPSVKHSYKTYIWLNGCYQEIGGEYTGGEVTQADWSEATENAVGFIKNKPAIMAGTGRKSVLQSGALEASAEYAHAEGGETKATDSYSHAEGRESIASGHIAHAEGFRSEAFGQASHAEGFNTTAVGFYSHAEGLGTKTPGASCHAEGYYTIARGDYSHVFGKYNLEDGGQKYAEIVGNGTYKERSNARTLDWNGNEWIAGKMTVGAAPSEDMDLTTKKYVDDLIAGLQEKIDALTPATT